MGNSHNRGNGNTSLYDFTRNHVPRLYWCMKKRFPLRMMLCDVPFRDLPSSTHFGHPYGITIRDGTQIGNECEIHQNVTIGQQRMEEERAKIGNRVSIGAGAIILGPVKIGDNATIAAGAIVLTDVPANMTYISKHRDWCDVRRK